MTVPVIKNSPHAQGIHEPEWMCGELRLKKYSEAQISTVQRFYLSQSHRLSFSGALLDLAIIPPAEVSQLIARYWGYPYAGQNLTVEGDVYRMLSSGIARSRIALPLARVGTKTIQVAAADPGIANFSQVMHSLAEKGQGIEIVIAPAADITAKIDEVYTVRMAAARSDAEAGQAVEDCFKEAFDEGVSDIHYIPCENSLSIEYRKDGVLCGRHVIQGAGKDAMINAVKMSANKVVSYGTNGTGSGSAATSKSKDSTSSILDVGNRTMPQDASATRKFGSARCNLRFSSMPTIYGEAIVIRLLDQSKGLLPISELGMQPDMFGQLMPMLQGAAGAVLMAGPTGSGKTTSMYSMIGATLWKQRGMALSTLENPVEYELGSGAKQTNITDKLTWAIGMKTLVRQDPDIIMVGECRDQDTAGLMIQASLTGHLIFSTIHANTAPQCFPRLMDLGIEPGNICAAVKVIIAQRLVRKLCPHCRKPHPRSAHFAGQYAEVLKAAGVTAPTFYEGGGGCLPCKMSGFKGQLGIFEFLPVWPFEGLLTTKGKNAMQRDYSEIIEGYNAQCVEIREYARTHDHLATIHQYGERMSEAAPIWTLRQDGMIKAAQGITSPEEVLAQT